MADRAAKMRVLFLCTGNSARSQMAEAWLRHETGDRCEAFSAGTHPKGVHPLARRAMAEVGVDLAGARSKGVEEFRNEKLDEVVTVCDRAKESCPAFPGAARSVAWSFDDPAEATGTEEERLAVFRRVRDEIRAKIRERFGASGS